MRDTIHGELARICGRDNAIFTYTINTATNNVRYYVDSYIKGERRLRWFEDYAEAQAYFDNLEAR